MTKELPAGSSQARLSFIGKITGAGSSARIWLMVHGGADGALVWTMSGSSFDMVSVWTLIQAGVKAVPASSDSSSQFPPTCLQGELLPG